MGKEWPFGGRSASRRARNATVDHHRHLYRPSLPGCMSTLFHFFDFHTHFVSNKPHPSSLDLSHHGVEAPRNSLELDEASISCSRNREESLKIQYMQMGLQIKTYKNGSKNPKASDQEHPSIDPSESPSAKTPNLLARLMGLDILPQTSSPSGHQPRHGACYHVSGTRSLPESPRASSSRLSDVDRHHHRLSLQISLDKENIPFSKEMKQEEEVRRKVPLVDITNNNNKLVYGLRKVEKSSKRLKKTEVYECSKLKNQEVMMSRKHNPIPILPIPIPMPMPRRKPKAKLREEEEEAIGCPTKISVKKGPSPPAAKVPHEQRCRYPKGKQKPPAEDGGERNGVGSSATADGGAAEFKYIKRILTSHGISTNTPISSRNWFSPSNPLNPSIFHDLETTTTTTGATAVADPTIHRWNRRLLFHLVDEVLGEILKSCSWQLGRRSMMKGRELAEEVREKVEEFPRAKCQALEDIDALIDKDLGKWKPLDLEGLVRIVEFHILDSLLLETVSFWDGFGFT